jgi:hypothetical protein
MIVLSIIAACGRADRFVKLSFAILRFISVCCCDLLSLNGFDKPTEPGNIVGIIDISFLIVSTDDDDAGGGGGALFV